ncbi:hypothetical protein GCM10029976_043830 [Kribbella albertanoniae]
MALSRRALLGTGVAVGVAAVAGLETGLIPGRARVHDVFGLTGPDGVVPDVPAGPVVSGTFESFGRRTTVGYSILYPDGYQASDALPVALVLHGRGGDHTSAVRDLGIDRYLTAAVQAGSPPFALATVDGGPDTYWHRRVTDEDPGFMIDQEFLPLLANRGLDTARYGVFGWSMGGYGALLYTALHAWQRRVRPGMRAVAVAALSPAVWRRYEDVAPGAFDSREDFEGGQLFGLAGQSAGCCRAHRLRTGRPVRQGGRAVADRAGRGGRAASRCAHARILAADATGPTGVSRRTTPALTKIRWNWDGIFDVGVRVPTGG